MFGAERVEFRCDHRIGPNTDSLGTPWDIHRAVASIRQEGQMSPLNLGPEVN